MIQIPEYFKEKARRRFGSADPQWIENVPDTLYECIEKWQLREIEVVADLSINFLCYAKSSYGDVVLKIEGPHPERRTEMIALGLYNGRYACCPLEIDYERGAILLERILPGTTLRRGATEEEQLRIGARLIRDLPIPVDSDVLLPRYRDWLDNAVRTVKENHRPSMSFKNSIDAAVELAEEISMTEGYLLHGDLHHNNILLDSNGEWRVIDPQGVRGAPVLECGRFIQNHSVDGDDNLCLEKAHATINYLSAALEQSKRTVWIAFYILHVLSFCWGYEMNYTREVLERGEKECAAILHSLP